VTTFAAILKTAVEATPNAIGGSFAAWDGELVDAYSTLDPYDWAVLTAHYGVILALLYAAFGTLHFGGPEMFVARHDKLDIVVCTIDKSYFALLAMTRVDSTDGPAPIDVCADAIATLAIARDAIRKEIA